MGNKAEVDRVVENLPNEPVFGDLVDQEDIDFMNKAFSSTNKEESAKLMRQQIESIFAEKISTDGNIRNDEAEPLFIGVAENVIGFLRRTRPQIGLFICRG